MTARHLDAIEIPVPIGIRIPRIASEFFLVTIRELIPITVQSPRTKRVIARRQLLLIRKPVPIRIGLSDVRAGSHFRFVREPVPVRVPLGQGRLGAGHEGRFSLG